MTKTIYIVDDHPLICDSIQLYAQANNYRVVGTANKSDSLFLDVFHLKPDVLILDLNLPGHSGIALVKDLKQLLSKQKIIIFTASESLFYQRCCLQLGVEGYLRKRGEPEELLNALNDVIQGKRCYPMSSSDSLLRAHCEDDKLMSLTRRELMVLVKLAAGYSNKEIAALLHLSNKTISTYKIGIQQKLGIKGIREIIATAERNHLI